MKFYAQDGVDVTEGDSFSSLAGQVCRTSYGNSPYVEVVDLSQGNFRGPRGYRLRPSLPGCVETIAPDGVGTKVVIIDAAGAHFTAGRDILAMTAGDITRWGGLPLIFSNVLDTATLDKEGTPTNMAARNLMAGLGAAARELKIVVLNGETAELPGCVTSENPQATLRFNWAGFAIGVFHESKMILGKTLKAGQVIMALKELSLRCNGISSARKALEMHFGKNWPTDERAEEYVKMAAAPAVLYDRFLTVMNGWYDSFNRPRIKMHLIVHITGGSLKSKFARDMLFPLGLSAVLDNLYDPPEIMRLCQQWRGMPDEECYETWHGGQGMLVVIDKADQGRFIQDARRKGIEAQACGEIRETEKSRDPCVLIKSKFANEGREIFIKPKD